MDTRNILVVYGPSGSGQDSVIEGVASRMPVERVVTTTTRAMRPEETPGHPYWFVSKERFEDGIKSGSFVEWARTYNDQYYGVSREELERVAKSGKVGLWKVDWRGAKSIRELFPEIPILFVTAPIESIRQRLRSRDGHADESYFRDRMRYIEDLLSRPDLVYDYTIENRDGELERAVSEAENIIRACLSRADGR
ncbi:MAG: hypothetical protein HGA38_03925 [Candidatus Moranbacteria bacterium]|nr:hypothetical protein [Candidatus Moranbacteria bacterium]